MRHHTLFFSIICYLLLGLMSCSDQPAAAEISKYQQCIADWETNFACLDETASRIDEFYDQWDEVYRVLPSIYDNLSVSTEQSFEEVEKEIQDCRDIFYQSLSELRTTDRLRTEFAPYIRNLKGVLETQEWDKIDTARFQQVRSIVDQLKLTCEHYLTNPVVNTASCQELLEHFSQLN